MAYDVIGNTSSGKPVLRKTYDNVTDRATATSTATTDPEFTGLSLEPAYFGYQRYEDLSVPNALSLIARMMDPTGWVTKKIDYVTTGAKTVVANPGSGTYIFVKSLYLYNAGDADQTVTIQSGTTELLGTGKTLATLTDCGPLTNLITAVDEDFKITLSAAKQLNGYITYRFYTAIP